MSDRSMSLRQQSAWLLAAKVVGYGLTFVLPILIVRVLTKEDVGTYRQVFQVIVTVGAILPLGVGMSAYYYLSREKERRAATVCHIIVFYLIAGGLAFATLMSFPQLLGHLFRSDEITNFAPITGIVIWLWVFSSFLEIVAVANQEAKVAAAFIVLAQLSKAVLMVGAVVFFRSVESLLYAAMVQGALQTVVLLIYLRNRFHGFWKSFDWGFFREQLAYALPFGIAGLLWTFGTDIHYFFVGYRFSTSDYAVYAYGCFQLPLISLISDSVTSVMIPKVSHLQSSGDKGEIIRISVRAAEKLSFAFFPIYVFLLITAETFVVTLFSSSYRAAIPIFIVNLTLLPFFAWTNDPIVRAYKELGRFILKVRLFSIIVLVGGLYYGIYHFGLTGMISVVVCVTIAEKLFITVSVLKILGFKKRDLSLFGGVAKTAICAVVAGLVTLFLYIWLSGPLESAVSGQLANNSVQMSKTLSGLVTGGIVLSCSFAVYAPIYLLGAFRLGLIDDSEKAAMKKLPLAGRFIKWLYHEDRDLEKNGVTTTENKNSRAHEV